MTNTTSNDNETPNNNNNNINSTTIIQDNIFHTGAVRLSTLHASTYHEDADNRSSDTDYLKKHLLGQEESLFDLEYLLSDSSTEDEKNKNSTKTTLTAMYPLTTNRIPIKLVYGKKVNTPSSIINNPTSLLKTTSNNKSLMDIRMGSNSVPYGDINRNNNYNNPPYNQSIAHPMSHHNDKTDDTIQKENDKQKVDNREQHNTKENEENTDSIFQENTEKNIDKNINNSIDTEKEKNYYKRKNYTQDDANRDITTENMDSTPESNTNKNISFDINKKDTNINLTIPIKNQNINSFKTPFNPYRKETTFHYMTSPYKDNTLLDNTPITIPELTKYNYNTNQITDQDLRIKNTPNQNNTNKHLIDLYTPLPTFCPQNRSTTHQLLQQKEVYPIHHNQNFNTPPPGVQLFRLDNDFSSMNSHKNTNSINPYQITQTPSGTSNEIKLSPELDTLKSVIASQHSALKAHIIDLGTLCLNLTNTIVKKKESSLKLMNENRIPRSLRIKCELTTSPDFENNPKFITLKNKLQNIISNCTTQGLEVMKEWSIININLLNHDRFHKVMSKAIDILLGIHAYWEDILYPIQWPNSLHNKIPLLIIKIYFDSDYIQDLEKILNFFELPTKEILLLTTKLITNIKDESKNVETLESIEVNVLQNLDPKQTALITNTLCSFDQILKATTIDLWQANYSRIRQIEASQKLRANLENKKIASATTLTARAIDKAIEHVNENIYRGELGRRLTELDGLGMKEVVLAYPDFTKSFDIYTDASTKHRLSCHSG